MRSFPALSSLLLLLTIGINLWLKAEPPASVPSRSTVIVQGVEYEVTHNPDGSESVSLKNRPFCTAAVRTNADGESEIRCLSGPAALEAFLADEQKDNNDSITKEK